MPKILHLTDLHILPQATDSMYGVITEQSLVEVLKQAHRIHDKFDLILVTGDLTQDPELHRYQRIAEIFRNYHTQTLFLPGNHDDLTLMQRTLNEGYLLCGIQSQLSLQNWQIIGLNSQITNSSGGRLDQSELTFLKNSLLSKPNSPTLIAMHHHCISTNTHWMDTMQIENSADLITLLSQQQQVKAVVFGHVHQAMEAQRQHIKIWATPATCFQFKPLTETMEIDTLPPGYRILQLSDKGEISSACHYLN